MILAIESSCDESALALFDPERGIVGEWVNSQIERHRPYGGVVPEIASREHLQNLPPLVDEALRLLDGQRLEKIVVTRGPGLAACLALGLSAAKALSIALDVPLYGANHLLGHAWSPFIDFHAQNPATFAERLAEALPHLGLVVSGGNTLLFEMGSDLTPRIVAETVDDAAGEALDKGAKLLGMPYPGGPLVEKIARGGDAKKYRFPRAFARTTEARFSFSGLKTSLRYETETMADDALKAALPDICASYQAAVVDALAGKLGAFLKAGSYKSIGLSGGVSNNKALRTAVAKLADKKGIPLYAPQPRHTGDNAAMIAFAAWANPQGCKSGPMPALDIDPSLRMDRQ
ncbi:MAG: tRNA (adenosine(37)-N6)-threonylcarbamoyltransferase complex transferase subunit TsaD [Opitutales bacterium]|nr:tRNA (adenosine(37)-N6)-threonylcarbamoyltransferase complex transferase subunit TsaD [Opitutales bacterium]